MLIVFNGLRSDREPERASAPVRKREGEFNADD